jgi:tetratricopeptide (TPR) repeat protein
LDAARKGQALDARNDGPALLALTLMSSKVPQAEPIIRAYLDAPATDSRAQAEVRMSYARILLDAQRYSEASTQVQIITKAQPDFAQAWLIQGTLEQQDRKSDAAENSLKRFVQLTTQAGPNPDTSRGLAQAYLSLAQIAEQKKDFSQAEGWLAKIGNTQDMVSAQSLRAGMLAKQGKLQEGLKLVRDIPERNAADSRMKILVEVQLLRDNKQYKTAFDFLAEKTKSDPPDFDLLYDQAMLADKLGQPSEMERLLRQVMAGKPGFHHAYNALGYSLADRNVRLPEARQLILKALEFAPDDPFISDSLGWVEFRSGNTAEAIRILQNAYQARPDAEIGAHLGEVLWASGKRQQAMTIWREAKALNPDNETLLETLKRLRVKL